MAQPTPLIILTGKVLNAKRDSWDETTNDDGSVSPAGSRVVISLMTDRSEMDGEVFDQGAVLKVVTPDVAGALSDWEGHKGSPVVFEARCYVGISRIGKRWVREVVFAPVGKVEAAAKVAA